MLPVEDFGNGGDVDGGRPARRKSKAQSTAHRIREWARSAGYDEIRYIKCLCAQESGYRARSGTHAECTERRVGCVIPSPPYDDKLDGFISTSSSESSRHGGEGDLLAALLSLLPKVAMT